MVKQNINIDMYWKIKIQRSNLARTTANALITWNMTWYWKSEKQ